MKVLLTGANGYIGRRLKKHFITQNIDLRLLVRNPKTIDNYSQKNIEVIKGDTFDIDSLEKALEGVDVAYYLIHSLESENYKELDKQSAKNFLDVAIKKHVKRIIYLGGLGVKESASAHLLSRIETGEILSSRPEDIQTIWIRAGVIIGSGSTSFEIIRHLIEKLPVMVTPKWVNTMAQPIAVNDVIDYLSFSKDLDHKKNLIVDIGSQKMTYKEMMLEASEALGLHRWIFPLPILTIKLSSYWLNLFTPVPYNVAKSLIEGLSSEVVIQNNNAKKYYPQIKPKSFKDSVKSAIRQMEENQVISRWSDAGGGHGHLEENHINEFAKSVLMDRQKLSIAGISSDIVYKTFCSIGGKHGWFRYSWLWEIRGFIDKLLGGAGLNRGRRDNSVLRVGDSVDFWRVEDLIVNERLLLYAQMKVPGKAWLEFLIKDNELIQTAYFLPRGIWGRIYWYIMIPIHFIIFRDIVNAIVEKSRK
jgi:uncharacterized protein YbjT (DUF2867 family)